MTSAGRKQNVSIKQYLGKRDLPDLCFLENAIGLQVVHIRRIVMNSLYHYFNLLADVYKQLTKAAIENDGKPCAYVDDDLLAPVLEYVLNKNEEEVQG